MNLTIRPYDEARDFDAVMRTWLEVGWADSVEKGPALKEFIGGSHAEVGLMDDEAECLVLWTPGSIRYQDSRLGLCAVNAVTTSHVGRKQGFATTLTARAMQHGAQAGCAVAALGMFEQGFYDRLGFGTAAYDNQLSFDPASLMVDHIPYRAPIRLTHEDYEDIHAAMVHRMTSHGAVTLDAARLVRGEFLLAETPYALGYRDAEGELTHFVYGSMKGERGPWRIDAIAYRSSLQLLELLRLLRELGDQVRSVKLIEPAHVQLQVLLRHPMRERERSLTSHHESGNRSIAWWQLRMLDVEACVAARSWIGHPLTFNLTLTDPVDSRLDGDWQGVAGDYTISIGQKSEATRGHSDGLPVMTAGVAAFTRMWFSVRPATVLAVTDDIEAPPELLAVLDDALLLPKPLPGWEF